MKVNNKSSGTEVNGGDALCNIISFAFNFRLLFPCALLTLIFWFVSQDTFPPSLFSVAFFFSFGSNGIISCVISI